MVNAMDDKLRIRESMSALADGQLRGGEFAQALELAESDADARASWQAYHLVGDVLRSSELAHSGLKPDFMARLQQRLQDEQRPQPVALAPVQPTQALRPAANHELFRWKLVAGVASFLAVGAISWNLIGQSAVNAPAPTATLALASTEANRVTVPVANNSVMIRDPHLDALLAAHKEVGASSALQGSTGFLRNATFEVSGR